MEAEEKIWQWSRKKLGKNKRKMPTECRILRATPCEIEKSCEKRPAGAWRRGRNSGQAARLKCSEFMEYTALFFFFLFFSFLRKANWIKYNGDGDGDGDGDRCKVDHHSRRQGSWRGVKFQLDALSGRAVLHTVCKWQWAWRRGGAEKENSLNILELVC